MPSSTPTPHSFLVSFCHCTCMVTVMCDYDYLPKRKLTSLIMHLLRKNILLLISYSLIHRPCQTPFTFTNYCHSPHLHCLLCVHLHRQCLHLLHTSANILNLFTIIPQHISPIHCVGYTAFFETHHIHIWWDKLPCCYNHWQRRVTLGLWFFQLMSKHVPLPRATHSKTALDGLSLLCSPQHLMPAVVRSSPKVWPQGLCLCNYVVRQ